RGAERGVTGERQLAGGGEDADPRVLMCWVLRRFEEHRLGQVQLPGDALHVDRFQVPAVQEDAELIAFQRVPGEHVGDEVAAGVCWRFGIVRPECAGHIGKPMAMRSYGYTVRPFHSPARPA